MIKKIGAFLLTGLLFFSANSAFAAIPSTLRVATGYFYPPFVYSAGGHPYGFDVALLQAVCAQMQTQCVFSQMPLTELFANVKDGNLDAAIGAISITPARKIQFEFSMPYFKSTMSYLGSAADNFSINTENLKGKKIGVVRGSTFETYLEQTYGNSISVREYSALEVALDDLSRGKINLLLMDTPVAQYWQEHSAHKLKIVDKPLNNNVPFDEGFGIVVGKNNYELVNNINHALMIVYQNGTYDQLRNTYFNQLTH